jgi:hypothetical protein
MNLEKLQDLEEKATEGPWISYDVNIHGGRIFQ